MKKFLLAGALVVFAGIAATVAAAAEHKPSRPAPAPLRATVVTPAKSAHKATPKKHAAPKKHHAPAKKSHHAK